MNEATIRTPDHRLRVYLSSFLEELREERRAVRDAVASLGLSPILTEESSRPHAFQEVSTDYVAQSHIFIGLYGRSYGWIGPGMTTSLLEQEYIGAKQLPKLIYVMDPVTDREPRLEELFKEIEGAGDSVWRPFSNTDELAEMVKSDLALVLTERFDSAPPPQPGTSDLPAQTTSFIGRSAELDDIERLILIDAKRLLTLSGPAGIGKSRLAIEALRRLTEHFPGGRHLVLLSGVSDPALVIPAIARTLGVRETQGSPMVQSLKDALHDKKMILMLDNFEHLIPAGPMLSELLGSAPELVMIVTSRAVLRLRGETEYPVPPMGLPDLDARENHISEAVELFVERARTVNPSFELTEENRPQIAEITVRLDGLPLAIELAAARTRLLPPPAMLGKMDRRLDLLTGGPRDLPERQRTLRAALDWDYDLLNRDEQLVFQRLSVFRGFTYEAAEYVAGIGIPDLMSVLDSLVGKSLVKGGFQGISIRFSLLRTLREYAAEQLETSGDEREVRNSHAEFFLALAERARPILRTEGQVELLKELETEFDNFRVALRWVSQTDADTEVRLCAALWPFWEARSHITEGRRWLDAAIARSPDPGSALHADILEGGGVLARGQGDYDRAGELLEQAVEVRRSIGDRDRLASALKQMGTLVFDRGDYAEARRFYEESVGVRGPDGDPVGIAETLNNLGVLARFEDDWDRAADHYERALVLFRTSHDGVGVARALMNLGEARMERGELESAASLCRESLALCIEVGSRWDVTDILEEMGPIAHLAGDSVLGARLVGAAEALREDLGTPLPESEQPIVAKRVAGIRDALGPERFEHEAEVGRQMGFDAAVALAGGVTGKRA